jgi:hypothetical protein
MRWGSDATCCNASFEFFVAEEYKVRRLEEWKNEGR